jgi:RiboL-PSP-HEPN
MVGSFERFLVDAFQEHLAVLEGEPPPVQFSGLPDELRISTVFASLQRALKGPAFRSSTKEEKFSSVIQAAGRVVSENVDPAALAQTRGNPSAERVDAMFKAIGLRKVFRDVRPAFDALWSKPEASTFLEDKLDEIVRERHVVAHTAEALQIGRSDLQLWPSFLEVLATAFDARLDLYVTNIVRGIVPP